MEAALQLVLPLFREAAGTHDQTALEIAPGHQLLHQQSCHDRLAAARVVGEQEAERLLGQHRLIDGGDLMRQGLYQRGVDRQKGIKKVSEADAIGFGDQAKEMSVGCKGPREGLAFGAELGLVGPVDHFGDHLAGRCSIGGFNSVRAKPLSGNQGHRPVRADTSDSGTGL